MANDSARRGQTASSNISSSTYGDRISSLPVQSHQNVLNEQLALYSFENSSETPLATADTQFFDDVALRAVQPVPSPAALGDWNSEEFSYHPLPRPDIIPASRSSYQQRLLSYAASNRPTTIPEELDPASFSQTQFSLDVFQLEQGSLLDHLTLDLG
jgi:hypothetical protein